MDPSPPEQSLFEQWRAAAREAHQFERNLARKTLNSEAVPEDEWSEARRLQRNADRLFQLFMKDMDARIKRQYEHPRRPKG
jgi:hypothetical protein